MKFNDQNLLYWLMTHRRIESRETNIRVQLRREVCPWWLRWGINQIIQPILMNFLGGSNRRQYQLPRDHDDIFKEMSHNVHRAVIRMWTWFMMGVRNAMNPMNVIGTNLVSLELVTATQPSDTVTNVEPFQPLMNDSWSIMMRVGSANALGY